MTVILPTKRERASEPVAQPPAPEIAEVAAAAWGRIAPLWTLQNFVAVNPYQGFADRPFGEAARGVAETFHARTVMPLDYHRERFLAGAFDESDLEAARADLGLVSLPRGPTLTYAELLDHRLATSYARVVVEELSKWCAARFDLGQAAWTQPGAELPLWAAFQQTAALDRGPELRGLDGFRAYIRSLPSDPEAAIEAVLEDLDVPPESWPALFARALASVQGWAGHVRYRAREAGLHGHDDGGEPLGFLAMRLAFEGAVRAARGHPEETWPRLVATRLEPEPDIDDLQTGLVWQGALERGYRRRLADQLRAGPATDVVAGAPTLQAVFCIDVRSEILRRHLEAGSERVQTLGFAGFFGFPVAWQALGEGEATPRCPALIAPTHRVVQAGPAPAKSEARRVRELSRHRLAVSTRLSTVSSFSFAETAGAWFGLRLLTDALGWTTPKADGGYFASRVEPTLAPDLEPTADGAGLDLEARLGLAEGALRGMSLTADFADVVLLCGHGSHTTNNPFGSGLDCGACGGHAGGLNARVAVEVLNDPEVRAGLRTRGIDIPEQTRFVAGQHDTTTDRVELFDDAEVPRDIWAQVRAWLDGASRRTRAERVARMGGDAARDPAAEVHRRSRDWSEVRPEWGLARNAAFVAARRSRTRCVDLDGRVFLHDYEPERDPEHAVLEAILTAPMVVAHWINMQYYASTVDNDVFGSGNKVLHNVVGRHGVQLGNRSDLKVGLPYQSVYDADGPYHEPLRLQCVIEAEPDAIDAILARQPGVAQLVDHQWITLVAWHPETSQMSKRRPGGGWTDTL